MPKRFSRIAPAENIGFIRKKEIKKKLTVIRNFGGLKEIIPIVFWC